MARPRSSSLTEAEFRIMDVVWDKGVASVADVAEALPADPPLAYNTVLTTMRILEDKGYLTHKKAKDGRAFVYAPVVGRDEATRKAVRNLVSRFFRNSPELLVLNVLNDDELSAADLKRIRKMIAEEGGK
jgi:predicted transcriptional regulator